MSLCLWFAMALFATGSVTAAPLPLQRGVNVHEWLNWSPIDANGDYVWPPYKSVDQWLAQDRPASDWPPGDPFAAIKALGFDYIRLTVDPGPLLANTGERRNEALAILKTDVGLVTAAGLRVVLNLHAVSQVKATSMDVVNAGSQSREVARYRAVAADVAGMLTGFDREQVAIEPFNEPAYYDCNTQGHSDWQRVMGDTVRDIRAVAPDLTIVATGACGGGVEGLIDIDPQFDDPNILYSFHMYEPHSFTHQRLDDPDMFGSGLPWPPTAGSPEAVVAELILHMSAAGRSEAQQQINLSIVRPYIADYFATNFGESELSGLFDQAVAWAQSHNIAPSRLFMGEFGAILMPPDGKMGANDADRLRYIADVRRNAETRGIAWSIWEYSNPYGMSVIVPSGPAVPDRALLATLGLAQ